MRRGAWRAPAAPARAGTTLTGEPAAVPGMRLHFRYALPRLSVKGCPFSLLCLRRHSAALARHHCLRCLLCLPVWRTCWLLPTPGPGLATACGWRLFAPYLPTLLPRAALPSTCFRSALRCRSFCLYILSASASLLNTTSTRSFPSTPVFYYHHCVPAAAAACSFTLSIW